MIHIMFKGGYELLVDETWEAVDKLMRNPPVGMQVKGTLKLKDINKLQIMRIKHNFFYLNDVLWIKEVI